MASFEDIRERALATAGKVADKSVEIAKTAGEKAKVVGKIAKLRTEVAMEKDNARKTLVKIGELYYEKHKDNPDPDMAQAVAEITVALGAVTAKTAEIAALKKELTDDFGVAAEDVADKMDDVKDDVDEVIEEIAEAIKGDDEA